jgi:hypothetical protein
MGPLPEFRLIQAEGKGKRRVGVKPPLREVARVHPVRRLTDGAKPFYR